MYRAHRLLALATRRRLPCVSHKECVAERGTLPGGQVITHLKPAERGTLPGGQVIMHFKSPL
jgi:hypothetical protein